jgi:8-oxo-dGTP pyrophosphatase MutT (NUDIX family)
MPPNKVRCSVLVARNHAVLLVHRTHDGLDDWVLPGGTPREGESLVACARRELLEETGVSADPSHIALVVESASSGTGPRMLDIVFIAPLGQRWAGNTTGNEGRGRVSSLWTSSRGWCCIL